MGPNLTATASSAIPGSTSQFSTPFYIGVCNSAPTASFTATPINPQMCQGVTFNATASSDPEDLNSSLQVRWDWNNDGAYETSWDTQKIIVRDFIKYGHNMIRLQVKDSAGVLDAATQRITVAGDSCLKVYLPLLRK